MAKSQCDRRSQHRETDMLHFILAFATIFRIDHSVNRPSLWRRDTSWLDRPTRPPARGQTSSIASRALDGSDLPLIL